MSDVKQLPCTKAEPLLPPVKQMSDEELIERLISLNATLAAQQERIEALEEVCADLLRLHVRRWSE
jgi:hypothetical protein